MNVRTKQSIYWVICIIIGLIAGYTLRDTSTVAIDEKSYEKLPEVSMEERTESPFATASDIVEVLPQEYETDDKVEIVEVPKEELEAVKEETAVKKENKEIIDVARASVDVNGNIKTRKGELTKEYLQSQPAISSQSSGSAIETSIPLFWYSSGMFESNGKTYAFAYVQNNTDNNIKNVSQRIALLNNNEELVQSIIKQLPELPARKSWFVWHEFEGVGYKSLYLEETRGEI